MSSCMPRGPNVAISLCVVFNAKQDLSYFCMRACCLFLKRLARLSGRLENACLEQQGIDLLTQYIGEWGSPAESCSANGRAKKPQSDVPPNKWDMSTTGKIWRSSNICMRIALNLGASCCAVGPICRSLCVELRTIEGFSFMSTNLRSYVLMTSYTCFVAIHCSCSHPQDMLLTAQGGLAAAARKRTHAHEHLQ